MSANLVIIGLLVLGLLWSVWRLGRELWALSDPHGERHRYEMRGPR